MCTTNHLLVLPRPSSCYKSRSPIPAPTEASFTSTFGALLPKAIYITTPHGRIAYYSLHVPPAKRTDAASPRVLLVHGIQTPAIGLLPLAQNLRNSFPCTHFILFDLYGHGLSETPYRPHTPDLFHGLIDTILDHLEWPAAHLVGYSFGGITAAGYAATRPTRVQSLALVTPAGLYRSTAMKAEMLVHDCTDEGAARDWILRLLEGGKPRVVPAGWRARVANGEVVAAAVREWEMQEHAGHAASVVAIFRDGGVMDSAAVFRQASATGVASLVVLGELDDVGGAQDFADVGFGNVKVVGGAGHDIVRERVREVGGAIGEFWKAVWMTSEAVQW